MNQITAVIRLINIWMKGHSESADMPKLPPQIGKLSDTDKCLDTKHKNEAGGGGITPIIGNGTLMRMFKY